MSIAIQATIIDLDWNCDGEYDKNDQWVCGDCLAEMEEADEG